MIGRIAYDATRSYARANIRAVTRNTSTPTRQKPMTDDEAESMIMFLSILGFVALVVGVIGYVVNGGEGVVQGIAMMFAAGLLFACVCWVLMALCYVFIGVCYILLPGVLLVGWLYQKTALLVLWVRVTLAR